MSAKMCVQRLSLVFLVSDCGSTTTAKRGDTTNRRVPVATMAAGTADPAPATLTVPARARLKLHLHGVGVQVYACVATPAREGAQAGPTSYAWTLKAPSATLTDADGRVVATHDAGPTWTSTRDASSVRAAKAIQVDADGEAIPWLLLHATSTSGAGDFADVSYIQRLATRGGKPPVAGCDAASAGSEARVDYAADYDFYAGGSGADWLQPPAAVPAAIAVPADARLAMHERGVGAQVYRCTAKAIEGEPGRLAYAWLLQAPDAVLYDESYARVGSHGAGPRWTANDGSTIKARKLAEATAAKAIPWLLLEASDGTKPGAFAEVGYVQRLNTAGGLAPTSGCDVTTVGQDRRVDYAADYYFFKRGGAHARANPGN